VEVIVLLKLKVDADALKSVGDTDDHIRAKTRYYVSHAIDDKVSENESMQLLSSCLVEKMDKEWMFQMIPSPNVLREDNDEC